MAKLLILIFLIFTATSISTLPIDSNQQEITKKYVLLNLVTDFSDLSKVNESLKTEEGKKYATAWLDELQSITCQIFNNVSSKIKTPSDQEKFIKNSNEQYLDAIAAKYYDKRRELTPWTKITFDSKTHDVTIDTKNPNDEKIDRKVTDPIITESNIKEYLKWPAMKKMFGVEMGDIDGAKKILLGKHASYVDFNSATARVGEIRKYLSAIDKKTTFSKGKYN